MRVLTSGLDKELTALLKKQQVSKVDIATAWATEGSALDALEEHKKQCKGKLTVRTMAGYSGNHTTPSALKRLAKLGKVRLVDGDNGMFHVKLFLFHSSSGSLAWVGSANFTGSGFGSNEELLYETTVTGKLQEWFDRRWRKIGAQSDQPRSYCDEWVPPDVPMQGVNDERKVKGRPPRRDTHDVPKMIVFVQDGVRPPPHVKRGNGKRFPPHGEVEISGDRIRYESAQECLKIVLEELQQRDRRFLERCEKDQRFHRRGGNSHYIARSESDLGNERFRKHAWEIRGGWWLSNQTHTPEKWKLILAAADVAGLKVEVDGKRWQPEEGKHEVGF